MREGARIDMVTGSPCSRDINVNGKEKRQGERTVGEGIRGSPEGDSQRGGRVGRRIEGWVDEEDGGGGMRYPVSPLLFPLIKISNMITADLATIIERLAAEFTELALVP